MAVTGFAVGCVDVAPGDAVPCTKCVQRSAFLGIGTVCEHDNADCECGPECACCTYDGKWSDEDSEVCPDCYAYAWQEHAAGCEVAYGAPVPLLWQAVARTPNTHDRVPVGPWWPTLREALTDAGAYNARNGWAGDYPLGSWRGVPLLAYVVQVGL